MYADLLYQILLAVLIVGGVFLILVLWRLYLVLCDVNITTSTLAKRVKQVDSLVDSAIFKLRGFGEMIAGFVSSFSGAKKAKKIIEEFWQDKNNSKEE